MDKQAGGRLRYKLNAQGISGETTVTEAEWLDCTNSLDMLIYLHGKVSERKLRLCGCACIRRRWHCLEDERSRAAIETSENFADGNTSDEELCSSIHAAFTARQMPVGSHDHHFLTDGALQAARGSAIHAAQAAAWDMADQLPRGRRRSEWHSITRAELEFQARIIKDIFGNPFRPASLDPAWLSWNDGTVHKEASKNNFQG